MNDGLALAPVLALIAALVAHDGDFVWWKFVLQEVGVGLHTGLLVGFVAARLPARQRPRRVGKRPPEGALRPRRRALGLRRGRFPPVSRW